MGVTMGALGYPEVIAGIIVLALNAYILMGGADFGGGVWDLVASGPRRGEQRALIASAIGPIWEANHVWLIVVIVMVFTAFPAAFAMLGTVLHLPLALMLVGIVLRGSAFVFRSYGSTSDVHQARWGRVFAVASTITPLLLGTMVGALSTEAVGEAAALDGHGTFASIYVDPWVAPFPVAVGVLALVLFALVAAVYLTVEAHDEALREDFRRRGLIAAVCVGVAAFGVLVAAQRSAPLVGAKLMLMSSTWTLALHLATGVSAVVVIWGLWSRRYRLARAAVIAQVSLILWGWAVARYPWLVAPVLSIRGAAAPRVTLQLLVIGLAAGGAILIPSLAYLFRTFAAGQVATDDHSPRRTV